MGNSRWNEHSDPLLQCKKCINTLIAGKSSAFFSKCFLKPYFSIFLVSFLK
uniref:Uncharacterized protein n=1 Tax=Cyclopterus lumpus TaxID=8103 RepID=A0A8C2WQF1_CYCLU